MRGTTDTHLCFTGNKGEWSELYVLLALLSGTNPELAENLYKTLQIVGLLRERNNQKYLYRIESNRENTKVAVYRGDTKIRDLSQARISKGAELLLARIKENRKGTFSVPEIAQLLKDLEITTLKAVSTAKEDLTIEVLNSFTNEIETCGFSVKSTLGSKPTLLNASRATNCRYTVINLTKELREQVNKYEGKDKINTRVKMIEKGGGVLKFCSYSNKTFARNLAFVDGDLPLLLQTAVKYHYETGISPCKEVLNILKKENPLNFPDLDFYEYKFKNLLLASMEGMFPSAKWNGESSVNGGLLVVTKNGELVAYPKQDRTSLGEYLLHNTKFERGSSTRHEFGKIYRKNGKDYINLNCQVRFT